jgi:hypothetical protein
VGRVQKFLRRIGVAIVLVIALAFGVHALLVQRSTAELTRLRAELLAAGEPVSCSALAPPPCAEEANSAPLLTKAFALLTKLELPEDARWSSASGLLKGDELAERALLERWVASNADARARCEEALSRPRCRFDLDYTQGFEVRIPHLVHFRSMAEFLQVSAALESDKDADRALTTIGRIQKLAACLSEEPFLISLLVRHATTGYGHDALQWTLSRREPSEAACRKLLAELDATAPSADAYERTLLGERCGGMQVYNLTRAGSIERAFEADGTTFKLPAFAHLALKSNWVLNRDEVQYLTFMKGAVETARLRGRPFLDAAVRLSSELPAGAVAQLVAPGIGRGAESHVRALTARELWRAALALRLHRLQAGSYPETLTELVPTFLAAVPQDPFVAGPVRYRREGAGFTLESPGTLEAGRDRSLRITVKR